MSLNSQPVSSYAVDLVNRLVGDTLIDGSCLPKRRNKRSTSAMGALVADLMRAFHKARGGYCYRSIASGSFSAINVGYHAFKRAMDGLQKADFVEEVRGFGGGNLAGQATRFR